MSEAQEVTLEDLRPGAIFVTSKGIYAVKSEYLYPNGECECVLLESGEYVHFEEGNRTLVREVRLADQERQVTRFTQICIDDIWWDMVLTIRMQKGKPVSVMMTEAKKSP